ncbi:hypothetical protein AB0L13_16745 [Saccharopolyspora shandongensis]|uniref:hypothetical protein n=1 Tax=Saccharopolyspora shandongensis TaxID=418495 RepID=UPI00342D494A
MNTDEIAQEAARLVKLADLAHRGIETVDVEQGSPLARTFHHVPANATPATDIDMQPGDVAITFGHQKWRLGIVTKTTRGRVAVEFTTPGAINHAARIWQHQAPRLMADDYIDQAAAPAARMLRDALAKGNDASVERYTQHVNELRDKAIAERAFIEALPGHLRHLLFLHTTCTPRPRRQVFAPPAGLID